MNSQTVLVRKTDKCEIYWIIPKGWAQVRSGKVKPWHWLLIHTRGNNFEWVPSDEVYQMYDVSEMTVVITNTQGDPDAKPR